MFVIYLKKLHIGSENLSIAHMVFWKSELIETIDRIESIDSIRINKYWFINSIFETKENILKNL